jgi:hypothetical protein
MVAKHYADLVAAGFTRDEALAALARAINSNTVAVQTAQAEANRQRAIEEANRRKEAAEKEAARAAPTPAIITAYQVHTIIWALVNGYWPEVEIDHISGDGLNNKIENLREVSRCQNQQNKRGKLCSSSKFKGVRLNRCKTRWTARIGYAGKGHFLGTFETEIDAARAYDTAAIMAWRAGLVIVRAGLNGVAELGLQVAERGEYIGLSDAVIDLLVERTGLVIVRAGLNVVAVLCLPERFQSSNGGSG